MTVVFVELFNFRLALQHNRHLRIVAHKPARQLVIMRPPADRHVLRYVGCTWIRKRTHLLRRLAILPLIECLPACATSPRLRRLQPIVREFPGICRRPEPTSHVRALDQCTAAVFVRALYVRQHLADDDVGLLPCEVATGTREGMRRQVVRRVGSEVGAVLEQIPNYRALLVRGKY